MPEHLYTLEQAKHELGKRKCEQKGHFLRVFTDHKGEPTSLVCEECEREWLVMPRGE